MQTGATPTLSIDINSKLANASANYFDVVVTSNTSWTANNSQTWCWVNPASGSQSGTVRVSYNDNPTISTRYATITFSASGVASQILNVTQSEATPTLSLSTSVLNIDAAGTAQSIVVNSNTSWAVSSNESWCRPSTTSGTNNSWISISCDLNTTTASRTATVTFSGSGITSQTVSVTQVGATPTLSIVPTTKSVPAQAGNFAVQVTSNTNWNVSSNQSWCTISSASGSNNQSITVYYTDNITSTPRTSTITFSATGATSQTLTVTQSGGVIDREYNVYNVVTIGTQTWMAENLKVTTYNNGISIPNVTDNTAWDNLTSGAYCWYNNEPSYKATYGALYNWYAVDYTHNVCPTGWHVPADVEWTILTNNLGGESVAGGKLKEIGTIHWASPNTGATNEKGFTGLPGGNRNSGSNFSSIKEIGAFWTNSPDADIYAEYLDALLRFMSSNSSSFQKFSFLKTSGYSVRCLKDISGASLLITPTTLSIAATGTGQNVTVTSNISWSVASNQSWCKSSVSSYTGNGTVSISCDANTGTTSRTATVTIYGGVVANQVVTVTQTGAAPTTVTDYDGNVYNTVVIGSQVWLKENLKVTHSPSGASINSIIYNDEYLSIFGRLYSYSVTMNGATTENAQGICPTGWHVPSNTDWDKLVEYLGGTSVAGGKVKETGTLHWTAPNTGATNSSNFTALPAGGYDPVTNILWNSSYSGEFKSSTPVSTTQQRIYGVGFDHTNFNYFVTPIEGYHAVRCIKN